MNRNCRRKTEKVYVKVNSDFDATGYMQPRQITWGDGRTYPIEQVRDFRPANTRITPAYAGKRRQEHGQKNRCGDHPRVCGEKGCWKFSSRNHSGSPPRMRGKAPLRAWIGCAPGITPAYAGKRHERSSSRTNRRDYPRVCGEKVAVCHDHASGVGSPPRMRGKD